MENSVLHLLKCIVKIKKLLATNNIDITNSVNLKRKMIDELEKHKLNPEMTEESYESIVNDIISSLEESEINESYLIEQINKFSENTHIIDSSFIDICLLALEEIGNDLIQTGDVNDPGDGGGPNNPYNSIEAALFGGDELKNNSFPEEELLGPRLFNVPTDKGPSPRVFTVGNETYDVSVPFTQQILRFEELGRIDINNVKTNNNFDPTELKVPLPDLDGFPKLNDYYDFMNSVTDETKNLGFEPTKRSNISNPNPWAEQIKLEIDPPDFVAGVAEGRMGGLNGEHQKWETNNGPKVMSVTCQTGAVTNNGCRDNLQMHEYKHGEFGQNGLYHSVLNDLPEAGTTNGITPKFHANLPRQTKEALWTFDGTFPPKLLMAKYGESHINRHYNMLPINPSRNRGFGMHTTTTHEHNGNSSGVSDGFANSFFFPGEYYDYLYPMTLAGYTYKNTEAVNPKASIPMEWKRDEGGNIVLDTDGKKVAEPNINIAGDWKEIMSTHWFHDHMLDYTSHNVYKGNAAMMNYYSAIDRGNEEIDDGVNLRLPSGTDLAWGNRDYDVNLAIADKAWDDEGQLWFNPFNTNGFLGDKMTVNWLLEPFFEVRARRYRFRILNAAVSRFIKYALVRKFNDSTSGSLNGPNGSNTSYERVPFWMIANCGNLMMHAVKFDGLNGTTSATLPVQAIAERFDIIVDFSQFAEGDELYFVNVLEHLNGKRPNREVPLGEILNGTYSGDPCVTKFMEFRVKSYDEVDLSMDPVDFEVGKRMMIPIEPLNEDDIRNAVQRDFNFVNKPGTTDEWAIETDGGQAHGADMRRLSAAPKSNNLELWNLRNGSRQWAHNIHIHYTEGKVLLRDGQLPPIWEQFARKDVYRVGGIVDSSESMVVALVFHDSKQDSFLFHCHNVVHEDHAMLLRFDVAEKGLSYNDSPRDGIVKTLPCPYPTWNGVRFFETKTLPSFRTGMLEDNLHYTKPELLIKKFKQIDKVVPDSNTGSYFVNGLGKLLQLSKDD
jgi:FtsP/CotA-like multicopper oxidase with cupredoxin domain